MVVDRNSVITGPQLVLEQIGKSGCYVIALCFLAQAKAPSMEQVVTLWQVALRDRLIESNGYVLDPIGVMRLFASQNSLPNNYRSVTFGQFDDVPEGQLCIAKMVYGKLGHFIVVKKSENRITAVYDPIGDVFGKANAKGSNTLQNGRIESFRLFKT